MTQFGTWVSYASPGLLILATILLIIAGILVYLGARLHHPLVAQSPGVIATVFMLLIWFLSIVTLLVASAAYVVQLHQWLLVGTAPASPVASVTLLSALVTFIVTACINRKWGKKLALLSAALCAMAAPMIFELPFDLIVFQKTYPPIPPSPVLYRALVFFPLFLVELSTISLLSLSPLMKLTRYSLFALAGMFLVFAIWAVFGFAYPSSPALIALNAISKVLAFVAAITFFLPQKQAFTERKNVPFESTGYGKGTS
jgi:uncharacterized PurR-regulated membrane protein YhhQ (DUF165 family)